MKILLTGKNGQLGWELNRILSQVGTVFAMCRDQLDLSKPETFGPIIQDIRPNIIVNAAAYTAVNKAESEPELAMTINGISPGVIAEEAKKIGAAVVHYSTDYVFDGKANSPYTEDDPTCPLSVYGKSKLIGEKSVMQSGIPHIILRTSWIYSLRGSNFLLTIQKLARSKKKLRIVDDQIGAPTWSRSIAQGTLHFLKKYINDGFTKQKVFTDSGIFHLSCSGKTSWFGFAKRILELSDLQNSTKLAPIPTIEYPTPAVRPRYSLLSNRKFKRVFQHDMPKWQDALYECLSSIEKQP